VHWLSADIYFYPGILKTTDEGEPLAPPGKRAERHCAPKIEQKLPWITPPTHGLTLLPSQSRPSPSQPELHPPLSTAATHSLMSAPVGPASPGAQGRRGSRACSVGGAVGLSRCCKLLHRPPREPADPGLVAESDVVNRIQTQKGEEAGGQWQRRPEQPQRSGSPGRSFCRDSVPAPTLPAPSVVVWAGECLPLSYRRFAGPPSPHPGLWWGLVRLSGTAATERGCFSGWRSCSWEAAAAAAAAERARPLSLRLGFPCRKRGRAGVSRRFGRGVVLGWRRMLDPKES
jgi:hypothetical protein